MQTIKVKVSRIRFPRTGASSNSGWVKLAVKVPGMNDFYVTGTIREDERKLPLLKKIITITGDWDTDPTFSGNFKAISIEVTQPADIKDVLVDTCKVSKAAAAEMVIRFGADLPDILNKTPYMLLDVKGITKKKLDKLITNWKLAQQAGGITNLLQPLQVSDKMKSRVCKFFGEEAFDIITFDPYALIAVPGISFVKVDEFALALGVPLVSHRRARAAALWAFSAKANDCGNTAITEAQLIEACIGRKESFANGKKIYEIKGIAPEIGVVHFITALKGLCETDQAVDFEDGTFASNQYYDFECQILNSIRDRAPGKKQKNLPLLTSEETAAYIECKAKEMGLGLGIQFTFSADQVEAIKIAASGSLTFAVCGYAGAGKSTIAKAILGLYKEVALHAHRALPRILCVALSGVAADRIHQTSGYPASTIHSALGWIPGEDDEPGSFRHNRYNPLEFDIILLDESSMVDSSLFRDLLDAINPKTRFIMLGDDAQLAPIGAADVFRDLLYSKLIPVAHLEEIFRTEGGSVLSLIADQIRKGLVPAGYKSNFEDFNFNEVSSTAGIIDRIIAISIDAKKWITDPIRDFQILSPMVKHDLGANVLNPKLQAIFNPPSHDCPSMLCNTTRYQAGDKVIHLRNEEMTFVSAEAFATRGNDRGVAAGAEESMKVCNGFIGIVCHITDDGQTLSVDYPSGNGNIVVAYNRSQAFALLGLAYCLSAHKYQGSEAKHVVLPVHSMLSKMLNNRWMYTAVTRAKSKVTLVGQSFMFEKSCLTRDEARRTTVLQRLTGVHELKKVVDIPPVVNRFRGWLKPEAI